MDIKKIPILGSLDFTDPVKRKNSIRICIAGGLLVCVLIAAVIKNALADDSDAVETPSYVDVEVPMGEDRDQLGGKTIRDVSSRGSRAGAFAENLISKTDIDDDPLAAMNGKTTEKDDPLKGNDENLPSFMRQGGNTNVFPVAEKKEEPKPEKKEQRTSRSSGGRSTDSSVRDRRIAGQSDQTQVQQTPAYTQLQQPAAQPQKTEPAKEENPSIEPVKVQVRRSGGVSSFGASGTELSNLGEQDEFVTDDPSHPFRAKFAYDEKVSSGQRVTIRLCEDMVVDGVLIPVNTHLFATCTVGERLKLNISSIDINGKIYTLNYTAYDNDGAEGLYCPQSDGGKVAKEIAEGASQVAQSAISSAITGYPGQLFQSGATAVRSKSGKVTVSVTAGYTFYLMKAN